MDISAVPSPISVSSMPKACECGIAPMNCSAILVLSTLMRKPDWKIFRSTLYGPEWRAAARVAVALVYTWVYVATKERLPMSETRLPFKEMCATFDVTPRTLRYYEYIELISPEREGRSRFYGPKEIARMTLILRGRKFGFALEEIRQWLLIYEHEGTQAQMRAWIELADRQLSELA